MRWILFLRGIPILTVTLFLSTAALVPGQPAPGVSFCRLDPNPIGGGHGYQRIITRDNPKVTAIVDGTTPPDRVRWIIENTKRPGSIIYFADNAMINLTGKFNIVIPEGVTLASGRGNRSQGAIIKTDDYAYWHKDRKDYVDQAQRGKEDPLFRLGGPGIRITGLRLQGPSTEVGDKTILRMKYGMFTDGHGDFELDNSELTGFPYAAVNVCSKDDCPAPGTSSAVRYGPGSFDRIGIHHNEIHHNTQEHNGYGVMVDYGYATIYANIFHHNRHDISGTGDSGSGYEAYCNIVNSGGISTNFDMHGANGDKLPYAGGFIYIHHNTFHDKGENRSSSDSRKKYNIGIRGKPEVQCRVENNVFAYSSVSDAIGQYAPSNPCSPARLQSLSGDVRERAHDTCYGNLLVWNNLFGYEYYLGWYVSPVWDKRRINNYVIIPSTNDELMSSMGNQNFIDYALGDFDGDGKTEVFKSENGSWYTLPINMPQTTRFQGWRKINTSDEPSSSLGFGYFNNDTSTDVFTANGHTWRVSYGGSTNWETINTSEFRLPNLKLADFNGDGRTDVFRSNGREWYVSYSGRTNWGQPLNTSDYAPAELAVGDFNGDGTADVFVGTGSSWQVSWSGRSNWAELITSGYRVSRLTFGDFTGNKRTDVMALVGGRWSISVDGRSSWTELRTSNLSPISLPYGQF